MSHPAGQQLPPSTVTPHVVTPLAHSPWAPSGHVMEQLVCPLGHAHARPASPDVTSQYGCPFWQLPSVPSGHATLHDVAPLGQAHAQPVVKWPSSWSLPAEMPEELQAAAKPAAIRTSALVVAKVRFMVSLLFRSY